MSAVLPHYAVAVANTLVSARDKDALDKDTKTAIESALRSLSSRQRHIALMRAFELAIDSAQNGSNPFVFSLKNLLRATEETREMCAERDLFIELAAHKNFDVDKELTVEFCEKTMEDLTYAERKRMSDKEIRRSMHEFGISNYSKKKRRIQVGTELFERMKNNAVLWCESEIVLAMCTRNAGHTDDSIARAERALCRQFERPRIYGDCNPSNIEQRLERAWKRVIEEMSGGYKQYLGAFSCNCVSYSPDKSVEAPAAHIVDPANVGCPADKPAESKIRNTLLIEFYGSAAIEVNIELDKKKLESFLNDLEDYVQGNWFCDYDD